MLQVAQRVLRDGPVPSSRQRRWRQYQPLLGLTLLAATVLGYWAVGERQRVTPRTGSASHPALPLIADSSLPEPRHRALDEVQLDLAGAARTTFTLQRRWDGGHAGFYLSPPGRRAEDAEVENLFSALLSTVAERRLERDPRATADQPAELWYRAYGVADEQCRVRARFGAGHSLCFGADSPSGAVYVRADQAPAVLVVDRGLFELLSRPPEHYRARRLVPGSLVGAHDIELGTLHLLHDGDLWRVRAEDGRWVLAEPTPVTELVQRLAAWSVSSWPAAPAGPRLSPPPSLGAPPLWLRVDGEARLRGGWPCPDAPDTQLFVRGDGEAVCAEVPTAQRVLPRAAELRAQRWLPVAATAVTRLQGPAGVDVVRQPDGTYVQAGQPADTASVRHLLELLTQRRVLTTAGSVLPPPGALRLDVTTLLGQRVTLQLWQRAAQTWAQRDHEPTELVEEPVSELFDLTPLQLAPRRLLTVEPTAVQRLRRRGSVDEILEHRAGWELRAPTRAPADSAAVATLLAVLTDLRAARWVAPQPRPEYGLEPPRLRLTITLGSAGMAEESAVRAAAERELVLDIGATASARGDCYARRPGAAVAVLPATTCTMLAQPLLSPVLLRLDEDRLTELQLVSGSDGAAPSSCTRRAGPWQCGDRPLSLVAHRALFTALHALQRGEPTYVPAPVAPPHLTLRLLHAPLGSAALHPTTLGPAAAVGEEVAPQEQTLRLYPTGDGGVLGRLDQRGVTYRLPDSALTTLLAALRSTKP